eukprot:12668008-Ditylum_brightwellii.AAC.1
MPQSTAKLVMPSSPPLHESPDSPITPCTNLSSDTILGNMAPAALPTILCNLAQYSLLATSAFPSFHESNVL